MGAGVGRVSGRRRQAAAAASNGSQGRRRAAFREAQRSERLGGPCAGGASSGRRSCQRGLGARLWDRQAGRRLGRHGCWLLDSGWGSSGPHIFSGPTVDCTCAAALRRLLQLISDRGECAGSGDRLCLLAAPQRGRVAGRARRHTRARVHVALYSPSAAPAALQLCRLQVGFKCGAGPAQPAGGLVLSSGCGASGWPAAGGVRGRSAAVEFKFNWLWFQC